MNLAPGSKWNVRRRGEKNATLNDAFVLYRRDGQKIWNAGKFGAENAVPVGLYEYRVWKYGYRLHADRLEVRPGENDLNIALKLAQKMQFRVRGYGVDEDAQARKDLEVELLYKRVADCIGTERTKCKGQRSGEFWYDPTLPCVVVARSPGTGTAIVKLNADDREYELVLQKPMAVSLTTSPEIAELLKHKPVFRKLWFYSAASPAVRMASVDLTDGTAKAELAPGKYVPIIYTIEVGKRGSEQKHIVCQPVVVHEKQKDEVILKLHPDQQAGQNMEY